jgi:hypothetical protein
MLIGADVNASEQVKLHNDVSSSPFVAAIMVTCKTDGKLFDKQKAVVAAARHSYNRETLSSSLMMNAHGEPRGGSVIRTLIEAGIDGEEDDEILSCSDLKHCRATLRSRRQPRESTNDIQLLLDRHSIELPPLSDKEAIWSIPTQKRKVNSIDSDDGKESKKDKSKVVALSSSKKKKTHHSDDDDNDEKDDNDNTTSVDEDDDEDDEEVSKNSDSDSDDPDDEVRQVVSKKATAKAKAKKTRVTTKLKVSKVF